MKDVNEKIYSEDKIDVTIYKCPNCGGEAEFDPKSQKMKCLYCNSLFEIKNDKIAVERDLSELLSEGNVWKNAQVYQCKTCGAKEILDNQEVSIECPFCGTNNIIKTDELPGLKPQGITPFKIDKETTSQIATKWAKKKFYAPRSFKKSVKAENIYGMYNPVFTFDAVTKSSYNGRLGENYTNYKYVQGRKVSHTETRYFTIKGEQNLNFDDFLIPASSSIPENMVNEIGPFPTQSALEYKTEYLRGYVANTYNKSGAECWDECKIQMKNNIETEILKKYDYDIKVFVNVDTVFSKEQYKYILVPIYVGHYTYKKKLYNFFVNGYTGKVVGKTPISILKVMFTVLGILLLIGGIVALAMLNS